MHKFHGSLVALITPFKNGKLDEQALERLVEWHIENGTDCLVPAGTTGECPTLTSEEHSKVIEIVASAAKKRIPVMAGAGSNNPMEAIHYSQEAQKTGADGLLHVAGYYNRPNQEGLYQHFKLVHDETNLPIFVYNIPGRAVVNILPETLAKIATLPRIAGVKDATGDLARPWLERALIKREDFTWLSGEDATQVSYNVAGGVGCISVTANVAPHLVHQVQELTAQNKWVEARELQDKLMKLHGLMFREPSPAGAKYAVSLLGLCSDEVRLPIMPLSDETKSAIKSAMQELQLI
ncbi:MAG: 4-hydroxy-tetrahydrodipicolinate synthase [Anaerobiospirillum succiniciproducens]|uniref:4-hydroxy-tetrahydrodipicolinate synthase n=1 Tax=Anaerobiospirillum succiniciproducens TaxID=13335 RepID=UPI002356A621|nr:4-hydroxy-tetrahydrodipicolinate synthase [Anaerobiospirillum succiniciproducens]MCI6863578.1 4-hydroxy-tetrahydrodipicolinate synthase [Anaerobiospirillum succiniciproducens]MDY2798432.1 4-hydroxy-tetrahydrodipicolinate synthase [Anaerobiospirillum succiniciproducens]